MPVDGIAVNVIATEIRAPNVRELHVDFLLEEEFCANPEFLKTFVNAAKQEQTPIEVVEVRHSAADQYGEADLLVVYRVEGNRKIALLIEDKIRAVFQPNQAQRYHERGEAGIWEKRWDEYWTCLVAPKCYIQEGHGFHASLCLEKIKDWLAVDEPRRHGFKDKIIEHAIKKAETSGVQRVDLIMTKFRQSYYDFATDFFRSAQKNVTMRAPAPTYQGDTWFEHRSGLLPKGIYVNYKSPRGFVDLTFPNTDAEQLKDLQKYLEPGMRVEQTGNSSAVRLEVPAINRFDDFAEEKDRIHKALTEVVRLLDFYNREPTQIQDIISRARLSRHLSSKDSANV
jgi:hypothetical protein